jgi:predicted RNase H-like HicB family nuclease
MRYLIVVEKSETGFSAYSPDIPGCVATGRTRAGVEKSMRAAIAAHFESMRAEGAAPPPAHAYSTYVEIPA